MKTLTLNIIKKNRKFFACTHNGYDVKLIIDEVSEKLELGVHELLVEDKSIRTKYGTDVQYQLKNEIKQTEKIVTLQSSYNSLLVESCHKLGGRWDKESGTWVFSDFVGKEVDDLDALYNDDIVVVDIEAKTRISEGQNSVEFLGYPIARACGRDSGAKLGEGIALLEGKIDSGGSAKNWTSVVAEGSKFRLKISKNLLGKYAGKEWSVLIKE